jgi:hypothetical protein
MIGSSTVLEGMAEPEMGAVIMFTIAPLRITETIGAIAAQTLVVSD